jgi:prepilin-type N-terminal cleavage/methylation domain-containing protein
VTGRAARRVRGESGYSLIEMLVTLVVLISLGIAFATLFSAVANHSQAISAGITQQAEARAALDRFASDLRQAYTGDPAPVNPTYPVQSVTSGTSITFFSPDRLNPFHLRRITYRLQSGELQRAEEVSTDTDGWPWVWPGMGAFRTLLPNVTTTSPFTFYDKNGATTTTASAVRQVRLQLTVKTNAGRSTTFSENVTLRSDV